MIKWRLHGEHVIFIASFLAIIVMGSWYMFVSASDAPTVSKGEHFQVESLAQSVTPASAIAPAEPAVIAFDRSMFDSNLEVTVYRGDTMQKIARRAIQIFLDEQYLTLEPWQTMAMEKIIVQLRSDESLRGKKTITFTHDEIAQAFEGIGEQSQENIEALTKEAEAIK